MYSVNETHDPNLKSWVASAQEPLTDFPIQNLPLGIFRRKGRDESYRVGAAIGDKILDIPACQREALFEGGAARAAACCSEPVLNALMGLGAEFWSALRRRISRLLSADCPEIRQDPALSEKVLVPMAEAELKIPAEIGDFTDFYASLHHAANVGSMLRPGNPLYPNYKHIPVAYHGRSSSILASGTTIRRPWGQTRDEEAEDPRFGASRLLDFELEVGFFIGPGNSLGMGIPIDEAERHIFGVCLVNDWSARDIQKWEYQPLGPFLSKSFATSISPWVVSMEALRPFRVPLFSRPEGDPQPLPHLFSPTDQELGGIGLDLEVHLSSTVMRARNLEPICLCRSNFRGMYWTPAQMVTHHATNGCNLRPGDLLASGTVSGAGKHSRGCLLELTWRGEEPLTLPSGETRRFLEDGDEVTIRGCCEGAGFVRVGLGECVGRVEGSRYLGVGAVGKV